MSVPCMQRAVKDDQFYDILVLIKKYQEHVIRVTKQGEKKNKDESTFLR